MSRGTWELDIAEHYPDFVSDNCASLEPSVGPGWYAILDKFFVGLEMDPEVAKLAPGSLQISDVKTNRVGEVSIAWHRYHDCVEPHIAALEELSALTCARCGHQGDIVRRADRSEPLCSECVKRRTP